MKTIIEYNDYKEFLSDRLSYLNGLGRTLTARKLARLTGFSSPSYFKMLVSGQRNMTLAAAKKIAGALKLEAKERDFLLTWIELEKVRAPKDRIALITKLEAIRKQLGNKPQLMSTMHGEILSCSTNLKLYLLAQSKQFKLDTKWLSKQFSGVHSPAELARRVELLISSGLWKCADGKVLSLPPAIATGDRFAEKFLVETHLKFLDLSRQALLHKTVHERVFGGRTFLFDKKRMPEILQRIAEFRSQLEAEFEAVESTSVYQFQASFFELEG